MAQRMDMGRRERVKIGSVSDSENWISKVFFSFGTLVSFDLGALRKIR